MDLYHYNYLAIFLAAIVKFGFGSWWYSPMLFGDLWLEASGQKREETGSFIFGMIGAFFLSLVTCFVLYTFITLMNKGNLIGGMTVGFWTWLGFIATSQFYGVLFEKKTYRLYFINTLCEFISFPLAGAVMGVMM